MTTRSDRISKATATWLCRLGVILVAALALGALLTACGQAGEAGSPTTIVLLQTTTPAAPVTTEPVTTTAGTIVSSTATTTAPTQTTVAPATPSTGSAPGTTATTESSSTTASTISPQQFNIPTVTMHPVTMWTRYEETDPHFKWVGSWAFQSQAGYSGGAYIWTNNTNASVVVPFKGTQIRVLGTTWKAGGIAYITLDSQTIGQVDTHSDTFSASTILWTSSVLSNGTHYLTVQFYGGSSSCGYADARRGGDRGDHRRLTGAQGRLPIRRLAQAAVGEARVGQSPSGETVTAAISSTRSAL